MAAKDVKFGGDARQKMLHGNFQHILDRAKVGSRKE